MSQKLTFEEYYWRFLYTEKAGLNLAAFVIENLELYDQLEAVLANAGLDQVTSYKPIVAGCSAILWDYDPKSDFILRIELHGAAYANRYWNKPDIIKPASILGKVQFPEAPDLDVILMPKVELAPGSSLKYVKEIKELYTNLRKSGLWWWDISAANMGFIKTEAGRKPILIDYDAVCGIEDLDKPIRLRGVTRLEAMVSYMKQLGIKDKLCDIRPEPDRDVTKTFSYRAQMKMPAMNHSFDIDSRMPVSFLTR